MPAANDSTQKVHSFTQDRALSELTVRHKYAPESVPKKKRVIVTGGSGGLGRWVVREMVDHGWEVYNFDIAPPAQSETHIKAKYIQVDLADYGQVLGGLSSMDSVYSHIDAVIHLSAIPAPARAPNHVVFHTNICQTYNVLEACRVLGITNIALASSETVLGLPFHPHDPASFPVKEDVERPESSYSLSKLLGEKMADQHCRWNPDAKIVNIRLSNVMDPSVYGKFLGWQDDVYERAWNGWCYIDARDCAQAFRLSIESSLKGSHVFNIANPEIVHSKQTTKELAEKVFPDVPYTPETDDPREGLISIKKAKEVLGWKPQYSWQKEVERLQKEGKV